MLSTQSVLASVRPNPLSQGPQKVLSALAVKESPHCSHKVCPPSVGAIVSSGQASQVYSGNLRKCPGSQTLLVGAEDGAPDGREDGTNDGAELGELLGTDDGAGEGASEGAPEGAELGVRDGKVLGTAEGAPEGAPEGAELGVRDGKVLGTAENGGARVGEAELRVHSLAPSEEYVSMGQSVQLDEPAKGWNLPAGQL